MSWWSGSVRRAVYARQYPYPFVEMWAVLGEIVHLSQQQVEPSETRGTGTNS